MVKPLGNNGSSLGSPQWFIMGAPQGTGVIIIASDDLSRAEFEIDLVIQGDDLLAQCTEPGLRTYTLDIKGHEFTVIQGTDYADALRKLFEHWNPNGKNAPRLGQERPILSA
jgi:hypothetical protein